MVKYALVLSLILVMLGGCQKPAAKVEPEPQNPYAAQPELFTVDPAAELTTSAGPAGPAKPAGPAAHGSSPTSKAPAVARTHKVVKGDTLRSLAKHYYNDSKRWKEIYDANRNQLSDPNALRVGQVLHIP